MQAKQDILSMTEWSSDDQEVEFSDDQVLTNWHFVKDLIFVGDTVEFLKWSKYFENKD